MNSKQESNRRLRGLSLVGAALALCVPALSQAQDFSAIPYVTYGDGNSYSLPIGQFIDDCTTPGCEYYVPSTPGAIKDLIVIATGSNGGPVNDNPDNMDNAYSTPNGNGQNNSNFWETSAEPDPGFDGTVTTAYEQTWDAEISALNTFTGGGDLVFYFNNNQINACDSGCQNLAVWAQLWITDENGDRVGQVFELVNQWPGNVSKEYDVVTSGNSGAIPNGDPTLFNGNATGLGYEPLAGDNDATDYVLSGGEICVLDGVGAVPCGTPGSTGINHNLGANEAAYAVIFPELDALIATLDDSLGYTLHVDINMGCDPASDNGSADDAIADDGICSGLPDDYGRNINNGYEQIFLSSTAKPPTEVPAPATVLLMVIGLLSLRLVRRQAA